MKKILVSATIVGGVVVGSAAPSYAWFCTNASKNPEAGTVEFKESKAQADFERSRAINSTGTGAWLEFDGGTVFIRNGLHPAASVGNPDRGIVPAG